MNVWQKTLFYSVWNKREKLVKIHIHEMDYERSLKSGVIPRGLRLKKEACLGSLTVEFKERWENILVEAELNLVRLLYEESIAIKHLLVVEYDRIWEQIENEVD